MGAGVRASANLLNRKAAKSLRWQSLLRVGCSSPPSVRLFRLGAIESLRDQRINFRRTSCLQSVDVDVIMPPCLPLTPAMG
jgi:hypothetical protein